ncbi:MAG TPA: hypothetical protein VMU11_02505 [Verrucomicrobiae bacterium]|nr:hypothetical protein [Verrucomicrobiae bacterium]
MTVPVQTEPAPLFDNNEAIMTNIRTFLFLSVLSFVFVAGCHVEGPAGPTTCTGTADAFACTVEVCDSATMCIAEVPHDEICGAGRFCRPSDPSHDANGCIGTPPPVCAMSCDDGVACTHDYCDSGACRHTADSALCADGQVCDLTDGCIGSTMPPPDGFSCVFTDGATRIGYAVRVRASGMHDVHTVPDNTGATMSMNSSMVRLWALGTSDGSIGGGGIDTGSDGWTTYSLVGTAGGGINTHPFITRWRYGAPEFNRDILNVADLQELGGRTCASLGIEVQTCMNPSGCSSSSSSWVALPAAFCTIAPDTVGRTFWSEDPVLSPDIRGDVAMRAVIWTDGSIDSPACVPVTH